MKDMQLQEMQEDMNLFAQTDEEMPLDQELNLFPETNKETVSDPYQNVIAADASFIRARTRESGNPIMEFTQAKEDLNNSESVEEYRKNVIKEYTDYHVGLYNDILQEEISNNVPMQELVEAGKFVQEDLSTIEKLSNDLGFPYVQGREYFGDDLLPHVLLLSQREKIAQKMEEYDWWDWTKGVAKSLIIPGLGTYNLSEMTGESFLDAPDAYKKIVKTFQEMPPEEAAMALPVIVEWVREAFGDNPLEVTAKVQDLFSHTAGSDAELVKWLERADVALTAIPILLKVGVSASKAMKGVEIAKSMGDTETAAKVAITSVADATNGSASSANTTRAEAFADASPFDLRRYFPHTSVGVSEKVQELLNARRITEETGEAIQRDLDRILDPSYIAEERIGLHSGEFTDAILSEIEHYRLEQAKAGTPVVGDVQHKVWEEGFQLEAEILVDGKTKKIKKNLYFSRNQDGTIKWSEEPQGIKGTGEGSRRFGSAMSKLQNFWAGHKKMGEDLVQQMERIDGQRARMAQDLTRVAEDAIKFLSGKERDTLAQVIQKIDNMPDNTTEALNTKWEAMSSYHLWKGTYTGIPLNEKQIAAYVNTRRVQDAIHVLRNRNVYTVLSREGYKEMSLLGRKSVIMRPLEKGRYGDFGNSKEVYNANTKKFETITKEELASKYDEGFTLVRFREKQKIGDDKYSTYALVRKDELNDLDPFAEYVPYKPGYSTRIYKDNYYAVSAFGDITVDGGRVRDKIRTERLFQNRVDAFEWAKKESRIWAEKNGVDFDEKNVDSWRYQIAQENTKRGNFNDFDPRSGLYTGSRAEHDLKFGLGGDAPERVSAYEELQRSIDNIAKLMPINEFRFDFTERWIREARKFDHTLDWDSSEEAIRAVFTNPADSHKADTLIEARKWLNDMLHIPTTAEQNYNNFIVRNIQRAESNEWFRNSAVHRWGMNFAAKDPFSLIRAVSFHTLLGAANFSQVLVQGLGGSAMAIAFDGFLSMPKAVAVQNTMALFKKNNIAALQKVEKALGMKSGSLEQTLRELDRTGLLQSVRVNADIASINRGAHFDKAVVKNLAKANTFFYNASERFARTYSFLVAKDRFLKKFNKPAGYKLTDQDLKIVSSNTRDLLLNLDRANAANWQKGWASVPTQYWQVTAKYMEAMAPVFGKDANTVFTANEARRIALVQLGAFGAAGVPFLDWVMGYAAEQAGYDPQNPPPDWYRALESGILEKIVEWGTDTRIDLSTRLAPASGLTETITRILDQGGTLPQLLGGASSTPAKRFYDALSETFQVAWMNLSQGPADVPKEAWITMFSKYASIFSSLDNLQKAMYWENAQGVFNNTNVKVSDLKGHETIWKAIGFSPKVLRDYYKGQNRLRKWADKDKTDAALLREAYRGYLKDGDRASLESMLWYVSGGDIDDPNINRIYENVRKEVHKDKPLMETLTKRLIKQSEYGKDYAGRLGD